MATYSVEGEANVIIIRDGERYRADLNVQGYNDFSVGVGSETEIEAVRAAEGALCALFSISHKTVINGRAGWLDAYRIQTPKVNTDGETQ